MKNDIGTVSGKDIPFFLGKAVTMLNIYICRKEINFQLINSMLCQTNQLMSCGSRLTQD